MSARRCAYLSGPDLNDKQDGDRCANRAARIVNFPGDPVKTFGYCRDHVDHALALHPVAYDRPSGTRVSREEMGLA